MHPGEKLTLTVTGRNTGGIVLGPVTILDEMAGLFDYTTYNNYAEAKVKDTGPAGVLLHDPDAATLLWIGVLAPGETVTVTYSVTVNQNASGETLENRVTGSATPPGLPPITPPPADTEHPVPLKPESLVIMPPTVIPGDPAGTPPPSGLPTAGTEPPVGPLLIGLLLLALGSAVLLRRSRVGPSE